MRWLIGGVLALALLLGGLYALSVSFLLPPVALVEGGDVPESYRQILADAGIVRADESLVYLYCEGLAVLDGGAALTAERVVSWKWQATPDVDDAFLDSMDLVDVVDVEWSERGGTFSDSVVAVESTDRVLVMMLPAFEQGDERFVAGLRVLAATMKSAGASPLPENGGGGGRGN